MNEIMGEFLTCMIKDQVGVESKDKDKYKDEIRANIRMVVSPKIKMKLRQ